MREEDVGETTLSLSFVDGISCGLAATILLFMLFGLTIGLSGTTGDDRGRSGSIATQSAALSGESVDLEIQLSDPIPWSQPGKASESGWVFPRATGDVMVDLKKPSGQGRFVSAFIRRLSHGFSPQPDHRSSVRETGFELISDSPPSGWILVYRSADTLAFSFTCKSRTSDGRYRIIDRIDLRDMRPQGECELG
jgi:hypothetical protein